MRWLLSLRKEWLAWLHDHSGVAAVFTVLCMGFLLGFTALVIDVGHVMLARTELQNAADAAALAGARGYFPPPASGPLTPDCSSAKAAATDYVQRNFADAYAQPDGLTIDPGDIKTGVWHWNSKSFEPFEGNVCSYTWDNADPVALAVQVTVRKNASSNNPVPLTLARAFGRTEMNVDAQAVAVAPPLGWKCGSTLIVVPKDCADIACKSDPPVYEVIFRNDMDDSAGWGSLLGHMNAAQGKCYAELLGQQNCPSCATPTPGPNCKADDCDPTQSMVGKDIYTQNGVDASVIMTLERVLDACNKCGKPLSFTVPVVAGGCEGIKWNGPKEIVGLTTFTITKVDGPPVNTITGQIDCSSYVNSGATAPAGSTYFGTSPHSVKLVK